MYEVKFNIVTPLWTGDSERKGGTVRETGIIGSLRWWYEILVRGLGGTACDPTNTLCNNDAFCDACSLFGCTGRSRKFKLEVVMPEEKKGESDDKTNVLGFMLKDGSVTLKFVPLKEIEGEEWVLLNETIKLIARYGALGGRTAQGNGVIKLVDNENDLDRLASKYNACIPAFLRPAKSFDYLQGKEFYDLRDFVSLLYVLEFDESIDMLRDSLDINSHLSVLWNRYHVLPIAPNVRRALRSSTISKDLFGGKGRGSRVFVSHGYTDEHSENTVRFRIFAFVRGKEEDRKKFCQTVESTLRDGLGEFLIRTSKGKKGISVKVEPFQTVYGEQIIANMRKGGDR